MTANRTIKYFKKFYYCRQHQKRVDKDHIDECSYIKGKVPNTLYNHWLNLIRFQKLDAKERQMIVEHFTTLQENIKQLENDETFITVDCKM